MPIHSEALKGRRLPKKDKPSLTYGEVYEKSLKAAWNLETFMRRDWRLDCNLTFKPDLHWSPEVLLQTTEAQRIRISQIRAYSYLTIICFIEEVSIALFTNILKSGLGVFSTDKQLTLVNFMAEELKHTKVFQKFKQAFHDQSGIFCYTLTERQNFTRHLMERPSLTLLLLLYHKEVTTYFDYLDTIKARAIGLDPLFCELLRAHWVEEANHTKVDRLIFNDFLTELDETARLDGLRQFKQVVTIICGMLETQARFDLTTLYDWSGHRPEKPLRQLLLREQRRFYFNSYLLDGLLHKDFRRIFVGLHQQAAVILEEIIEQVRAALPPVQLVAAS